MPVSRAMMNIGMSNASHGAIWATNTIRTNARRPRHRIRATANAASSATTRASSTATTVTSRLLRQKVQKPSRVHRGREVFQRGVRRARTSGSPPGCPWSA